MDPIPISLSLLTVALSVASIVYLVSRKPPHDPNRKRALMVSFLALTMGTMHAGMDARLIPATTAARAISSLLLVAFFGSLVVVGWRARRRQQRLR